VAITELRLIRTLEHVEVLKDSGHWSFRQPKKQRGVGGLTKTHRDYLMDEMVTLLCVIKDQRTDGYDHIRNGCTSTSEKNESGN
jgi:chromatin modification-related protein VID21